MATSRETKKFVDSAGVTKIYQTFKSDLQTAVGVIDQAKANTSHTHVMADITDFSGGGGGVGQEYKVEGVTKGEIFNDYTNNIASGAYSHAEEKVLIQELLPKALTQKVLVWQIMITLTQKV